MKKLIKNYTTEVPVEKTITEIQKMLVENDATGIATEYDQGRIRDIFFKIKVDGKELAFRLPAKSQRVFSALYAQTQYAHIDRYKEKYMQESEKIAWRICKSWLEAQITLINLEQATMEEVFLPYLIVGRNNESLFMVMKEQQFLLSGGSK